MRKIRLFDLSVLEVVERYYLMVGAVVGSALFGQFTLATVFGFSIAVSAILGVSYRRNRKNIASIKVVGPTRVDTTSDWQEAA